LWITASKWPSWCTCSATLFIPARVVRSPTTTASAPGELPPGFLDASGVPGMEHRLVPLLDQELAGHQPEASGGTGDQDPCHARGW
jgi:hypothetical protein